LSIILRFDAQQFRLRRSTHHCAGMPARLARITDEQVKTGIPNLSLITYPFSIPRDEHAPLQYFNR